MSKRLNLLSTVACAALVALAALARPALAEPSVAVMPIASDGVAPQFTQTFDAGKALTDILTNKLVDTNKVSVVDRIHIDQVFNEQKLSQSSDFQQTDAVRLGHSLGANFLLVGRIVVLDQTQQNQVMGGVLQQFGMGGVGGKASKVRIQVTMQVLDATTGRIVKSLTHEQSKNATGVLIGDISTGVGGYSGQSFENSIVGQLLNETASDFADKISSLDFSKIGSAAAGSGVTANVISMDGTNPIIDKGTADGVKPGTYFTFYHQNVARLPSGKTITTNIPDGHGEITHSDANSSVMKLIDGKATVGGTAVAE